ncbi:MAG TPA: glycyl-radical enzyme activating protein [Ignavibacteriaceae bacterium]|nr:glycyl-radical enzyme activating protein [Ignavibacteriaceae bacterium]
MTDRGVIFDINKYAVNDGPGIRTTIFLKGCPLDCGWCHNPESRNSSIEKSPEDRHKKLLNLPFSETRNTIGMIVSVKDVMKEIKKDTIFYEESGGGVTFSGGEPLMQPDFLLTLLRKCKELGIHTAVDTSGYASTESFKKIQEVTDLFLFDLKVIDNRDHIKFTGVPNGLIHKNLMFLSDYGKEIRIRIPLIPGVSDTEKNLNDTINFILSIKNISGIDLLPFNELIDGKYKRLEKTLEFRNLKTQTEDELSSIHKIFEECNCEVNIRG